MCSTLHATLERIELECRCAAQAENSLSATSQRCQEVNDARFLAEQDAARVWQELWLYKLKLDHVQHEISRAQESLRIVESQRDEADASAARARTIAQQLNQECLVQAAREGSQTRFYGESEEWTRDVLQGWMTRISAAK
jgi:chromosome segregation ATPase